MAEYFFSRVGHTKPFNEMSDYVRQKTTLRTAEILLSFDLFIYALRKKLIKTGKVKIKNFGVLYTFSTSKKKIRARFAKILKKVINKQQKLKPSNFLYNGRYSDLEGILLEVGKLLAIKPKDTSALFGFFIFALVQELLKNGYIKIRNFGIFYVLELQGNEKKYKKVFFKPCQKLLSEINSTTMTLTVPTRVAIVFKIRRVNVKIENADKKTKCKSISILEPQGEKHD